MLSPYMEFAVASGGFRKKSEYMVALQYMEHRPPQVCNAAVYSDSAVMVHCDDEVILIITTA